MLFVCLTMCLSVCLSVCPCDYLSARLATWQCVCLSDYLYVCLSMCLSARVAVCCLPLDFSAAPSYSSILILLLTLKLRRCSDMILLFRRS